MISKNKLQKLFPFAQVCKAKLTRAYNLCVKM